MKQHVLLFIVLNFRTHNNVYTILFSHNSNDSSKLICLITFFILYINPEKLKNYLKVKQMKKNLSIIHNSEVTKFVINATF